MSTINEQENAIVTSGYANTLSNAEMARAQATTVTSTSSTDTITIGQLGNTLQGNSSGLTWTYDGTTTQPDPGTFLSGSGSWTTGITGSQWPILLPEATKEEIQKIIKNQEVQIEINGEMKTCKLSDLLNTGYLTLKSL